MNDDGRVSAEIVELRQLAANGQLTTWYEDGSKDRRRRMRAAAGSLAAPLLFQRVTRRIEWNRMHYRCASGVASLSGECLDRFHQDLDAVLDDLFRSANRAIANLEGFMASRMRKAIIDAYRRRRGDRGAPQRPRVPGWLVAKLDRDPWLVELARLIMDWVGADHSGPDWPLGIWAERRLQSSGSYADDRVVAAEVEAVLNAMRSHPDWCERYIEAPRGLKSLPVWPGSPSGAEPNPMDLNPRHVGDDALLRELAATAMELIQLGLAAGGDRVEVVAAVIDAVFGTIPAAHGYDSSPESADDQPGRATALLEDPDERARIVEEVLRLLDDGN